MACAGWPDLWFGRRRNLGAFYQSGPRFDWLLMLAAAIAAIAVALLSVRLLLVSSLGVSHASAQNPHDEAEAGTDSPPDWRAVAHQDMFDSTGSAVVAMGVDGSLTYVNSSAERMLGYHAHELKKAWGAVEILAPGEGDAPGFGSGEAVRIPSIEPADFCRQVGGPDELRAQSASQSSAELRCAIAPQRRNVVPVTLHISALRNSAGMETGLVAVAMDKARRFARNRLCASRRSAIATFLKTPAR